MTDPVSATSKPTVVRWLNRALKWRIELSRDGKFALYNAFGYAGSYATLGDALRADDSMAEPTTT